MSTTVAQEAAARAAYWAAAGTAVTGGGPSVGYSQPNREGIRGYMYVNTPILQGDVDADCSSLVAAACNLGLMAAYPALRTATDSPVLLPATAWTGSLRGDLEARGWAEASWPDDAYTPAGGFRKGDVVLSAAAEGGVGHVAIVVDDNGADPALAEAWIAETGDIHGAPGDQTDVETRTVQYSQHPYTRQGAWTSCHRFSPASFAQQHPDCAASSMSTPASAPAHAHTPSGGPLLGVDISNHQAGINIAGLGADFIIVMATQGDWFTNPHFNEQVNAALALGVPVGTYHYVDGSGVEAEVGHFLAAIGEYRDRVFLAVDWEAGQNDAWGDDEYLRALVMGLRARIGGRRVLLYASSGVYPRDVAAATDSVRWVAQYASDDPVGWDANPWTDGTWTTAGAIHQYTGTGRLPGYGGNLDLNVFHGDENDLWALVAAPAPGGGGATTTTNNRRSDMLLIETTTPWGATAWALITESAGAAALGAQQAQAYNAATGYCGRVPWDHYELLVREAWQRRNDFVKALGGEVRESVDTATRRFLDAVRAGRTGSDSDNRKEDK